MRRCTSKFTTTMAIFTLALSLALVVACGGASPTEAPSADQSEPAAQQQPAGQQASGQQQVATKVPIATIAPTLESPAAVVIEKPVGILTSGQKELGPFIGHPNLAGNPRFTS